MNLVGREQRIEEIEPGLAELFASTRTPAIRSYAEGSNFFIHLS